MTSAPEAEVAGPPVVAAAFGHAGVPLVERHIEAADSEGLRNDHLMRRRLAGLAARLLRRRAEKSRAARRHHHLWALVAFFEHLAAGRIRIKGRRRPDRNLLPKGRRG